MSIAQIRTLCMDLRAIGLGQSNKYLKLSPTATKIIVPSRIEVLKKFDTVSGFGRGDIPLIALRGVKYYQFFKLAVAE